MKIRCDVCEKAEASVFCCADEAALCEGCDGRVHHANKLATKHLRFSLLLPSCKHNSPPLCDICQERRAFLFCQEDRAILCRECDLPIHRANEHTQKHNRFLLTGVKLSPSSTSYPSISSSSTATNLITTTTNSQSNFHNKPTSSFLSNEIFSSPSSADIASPSSGATCNHNVDEKHSSENGSISASSFSEYLETVPGWRVDEFLDPFFANSHGFSKVWSTPYI